MELLARCGVEAGVPVMILDTLRTPEEHQLNFEFMDTMLIGALRRAGRLVAFGSMHCRQASARSSNTYVAQNSLHYSRARTCTRKTDTHRT